MCVHHTWWPEEGIRIVELKCQMLVSHHARAGNRTQVLSKSSKCSRLLSHLYSPKICFLVSLSVSLCVYHAHVVVLEGQSPPPHDGAAGDYEACYESSERNLGPLEEQVLTC